MATFSFEIEDSEIASILKGDASFAGQLRAKILNMRDLPGMKEILIEEAKSQVALHLKEDAWFQIDDAIREQMDKIISEMIKERDEMIQEKVKEGVKKLLALDFEKVMLQAAKEIIRESLAV